MYKEAFLLFVIEENCAKSRYVLLAGNDAFRLKTSYTEYRMIYIKKC